MSEHVPKTAVPVRMLLGLAALAILLVCSCSIPLYERAEISPGLSLGAGVSAEAAWQLTSLDFDHIPGVDLGLCLTPTFSARYGFSERAGMFVSTHLGCGWWLGLDSLWQQDARGALSPVDRYDQFPRPVPYVVDFRLGGKFRVGERGALVPALSFPGIIDLDYLHDFGPDLSGRVGLGIRGISVGLNASRPLGERLRGYVGLTVHEGWASATEDVRFIPSVALGCALEWSREPLSDF